MNYLEQVADNDLLDSPTARGTLRYEASYRIER
jgi:hypothetical protein